MRDGSRRTVEISEIGGLDPLSGEIEIERLFVFREEGFCDGRITGGLVKTGAGLRNREKLAAAGLSSEI